MDAFQPSLDRLLVQPKAADTTTKSGILIPATARGDDNVYEAVVRAVGPGRILNDGTRIAISHKVGDTVLVAKDAKTMVIKVREEEHHVVAEAYVLGTVIERSRETT